MAIARPIAIEIDRIARRAHRFHRFAHHPLCGAYASELVRIGRRGRVCRGCSYTALGLAVGILAALIARPTVGVGVALAGAAVILLAAASRRRLPKWSGRGLPAALASAAMTATVLDGALPAMLALAAVAALAVAAYRRRGPDRSPCHSCPEASASPCSGLRPIIQRERAFRRVAQGLIDRG